MVTSSATLVASFGQECAVLEIGPTRRKYYIHKALLSQHSEYFRKALKGPWKEAEEGVVTLTDVEPETVNIFSYWLYTQQLPETDSEWTQVLERGLAGPTNQEKMLPLLKAYSFGDRFLALSFRQVVNRAFVLGVETLRSPVCWDVYHFAFEHIPSDRVLLQSLVDDYCNWGEDMIKNEKDDVAHGKLPSNFLARVVRELWGGQHTQAVPGEMKRCYHEHVTEKEKADCNKLHMAFDNAGFGYF